MRVHHLNCGTMDVPVAGPIVCHVLLCETADRLVLVDTGFGLADVRDPKRRLGAARHMLNARLNESETAIRQVEALGHSPADVRDIVLTHFDLDHVGGLADFPHARVHVAAAEWQATQHPTLRERTRYRPVQWQHNPTVITYTPAGERWRGLPAARPLDGLGTGFALVPLIGHTRGHAAVAVDAGQDGWLLHAGDAYFHRSALGRTTPWSASGVIMNGYEKLVAADVRKVGGNHRALAELPSDVTVFSAHDPVELAGLQDATAAGSRLS